MILILGYYIDKVQFRQVFCLASQMTENTDPFPSQIFAIIKS